SERKTQPALAVAQSEQAVFAPPISAAARVLVRKVFPALAGRRIVLADCPPLPLRQVRTPPFPVFLALSVFVEAIPLGIHWATSIIVSLSSRLPESSAIELRAWPRSSRPRKIARAGAPSAPINFSGR